MTYSDFAERIMAEAKSCLNDDFEIEIRDVLKNNDMSLKALTVGKHGEAQICVYLEPYYSDYCKGSEFNKILEEVVKNVNENLSKGKSIDIDWLKDWDKVKDRLYCMVINTHMNKERLKKIPHRSLLDLSVVYYVKIDVVFSSGIVVLTHDNAEIYKKTEEELYSQAMANTVKQEVSFKNINAVLFGNTQINSDAVDDVQIKSDTADDIPMYVLDNKEHFMASVQILNGDFPKNIGGQLNDDYYILPSSLHELIVVPVKAGIEVSYLRHMVKDINKRSVEYDDRLSDNVYRYYREKEEVMIEI